MPSKGLLWSLTYTAFSIVSFGISLLVSASNSYDVLTFSQELTSDMRLTILLNFIAFCFLSLGYLSIKVIFRQTRIIEIEHIADQLPFYGLSLLFILFNDNSLILNTALTGLTLLSKVHHIMTYDRVDFLQVQVVNKMSSQQSSKSRVLASFLLNGYVIFLLLLLPVDFFLARVLAYDVFQGLGSMGSLLFGIQFGVMGLDCFAFTGKLALNVYELVFYRCNDTQEDSIDDEDDLEEHIWENRAIYVQGFEIVTSIFKTLFYAIFLYTLYFHSRVALPIPLLQGCIISMHQAFKQIYHFVTFFSQSRHLEKQLAGPTEEELVAADHMCIICREDMHFPASFIAERGRSLNPRKHPKKLSCGHILHLCCLKDWLERSDSCPLCRKVVFSKARPGSGASGQNIPPPDPAPVDRPAPPAETSPPESQDNTNRDTPAGFTRHVATAVTQNVTRVNSNPETQQAASTSTSHETFAPPIHDDMRSGDSAFIPKDWSIFAIAPTSEEHRFDVQLSATETAKFTVRQSRIPN